MLKWRECLGRSRGVSVTGFERVWEVVGEGDGCGKRDTLLLLQGPWGFLVKLLYISHSVIYLSKDLPLNTRSIFRRSKNLVSHTQSLGIERYCCVYILAGQDDVIDRFDCERHSLSRSFLEL